MLLRAQNAAWSADPDPSDESGSWESVMLHAVQRNERSCSPEPSLAMDCHASLFRLRLLQKLLHNLWLGSRAVDKVQLKMLEPFL